MPKKVRKAVIPAAGYGTRMLPITKTVPKEILPIVDKPIIQMVVEELVEAGIENVIIVTSPRKAALVEYFGDVDPGLADHLGQGATKAALLKSLEDVKDLANFAFVEQHGVYGTGTPVLCAEPYIGDEPFIYTFADDFFVGEQNSFKQMIEAYQQFGAPVIGTMKQTTDEAYNRYGYVGGNQIADHVTQVNVPIVERPGREHAPGELASLGGFVVTPDVLRALHEARDHLQPGEEFYFHSALSRMIQKGEKVIAREITGAEYFDTGDKLEYMKTAVAAAARHPEIGSEFQKFLQAFTKKGGSDEQ